MRNCPNCGASLEDGDAFCGACGTTVGEDRGTTPSEDRETGYDQPGGRGDRNQPGGHDHRGDQHRQGQPDHQGQPGHQGGQPPRQQQGGPGGQQGRPGGQQGAGGPGRPTNQIGGAAQQGQPAQQGYPPQQGQPRGPPGGGQPHQGVGHGQAHIHHRPNQSGRRETLKYGLGAVVVLGGGWLLYDSVLDSDLTPEEQAAKEVVERNMQAYENEDIQGVRDTTHPESPAYDQTVQVAQVTFEEYDLSYELEVESVEVDGEEARVEVIQTTRKESGPTFQDNRIEATHVLRKYNGEWRIYNTLIENVEYLN